MNPGPPRVLRRILTWVLPRGPVRDGLLGDLDELYAERAHRGRVSANLWYAHQLLSAAVQYTLRLRGRGSRLRGGRLLDELGTDLGLAFRMLRRSPGFTAAVVLTLALGIGATTAIFSVVDGVLLRPLPYPAPDQLVRILSHHRDDDPTLGRFSREDFADLKQDGNQYESVAAYLTGTRVLTESGEPQELDVVYVTPDYFRTLGVSATLGRTIGIEENVPGADDVILLSDKFWRSRFASDPGVIGTTLQLDGAASTILGIMPPWLDYPSPEVDMYVPASLMGCNNVQCNRGSRFLRAVARLAPSATLATAAAATRTLAERLEREYPESNAERTASVIPLRESLVGDVRPQLLMLLGAVGFVLLITCANVANLLLARGTRRGREFAIRAALGAGPIRVIRQLLTESVVLALLGGASGFLLAFLGVDLLVALGAGSIPRSYAIQTDIRIGAFALAASVLTGVLFGLLPSLKAARVDVNDSLKAGGRSGSEGPRRQLSRGFLIGVETALAVILVTGAGLLMKSFWNLTRVDTGFRAENVLSLSLQMSADVMGGVERDTYRREVIRRISGLPGVIAAGGGKDVPLHGVTESYLFTLTDRPGEDPFGPETSIVMGRYFDALGIPLVAGRLFTTADETNEAPVVIVNQALAERYWPDRDASGETLLLFGDRPLRIVGVVGDVRQGGIMQEPAHTLYILPHYGGRRSMTLFVRTASDPSPMADAFRQTIWELNPDQPISVSTMNQVVSATVAEPRFVTTLLGSFAGLAVVLALLGVYGVTAYEVSRRTYEVGVRIALGAKSHDVVRLIIAQGIRPVLAGLVIGLIAAHGLTSVLGALLYGVEATDPWTFTSGALMLVVLALLAVYLPARRATRVDPNVALRAQ